MLEKFSRAHDSLERSIGVFCTDMRESISPLNFSYRNSPHDTSK